MEGDLQLAFWRYLGYKIAGISVQIAQQMSGNNAFLFKVGLASARACSFCGDMDESLEHLITSCHYFGQIQSTIMCNGTTAVRICEKKLFTM